MERPPGGADAVVEESFIAAPPARVFDAWTREADLLSWWGDGSEFKTVQWTGDLRPGGRWLVEFADTQGNRFSAGGEYTAVNRPSTLHFTWQPDWSDDPPSTVELDFAPDGSGTRLRLCNRDFSTDHLAAVKSAWSQTLGWLKDYLAPPAA